jgi:hypothetical protein
MDPIANIAGQRKVAAEIIRLVNHGDDDEVVTEIETLATRLAELVQALDEWRRKGGFDPYKVAKDASNPVHEKPTFLRQAAEFLARAADDNEV